jgi:hypothetical protein
MATQAGMSQARSRDSIANSRRGSPPEQGQPGSPTRPRRAGRRRGLLPIVRRARPAALDAERLTRETPRAVEQRLAASGPSSPREGAGAEPSPPRPAAAWWRGAVRLLPAAALLAYAACCLLLFVDPRWRPEWDSAIYVLSAQGLAAGEGYHYLGLPVHRPPGLSALLALVQGEGPFDPAPLNRLIMLFAALAVAACYAALRPLEGRALALAVALAAGTAPLVVRSFNWIQSEFPFLALLFATFALLRVAGARRRHWWLAAVAGGACLAGAFYLRTAALLVWPATLLVGVRHDRGLGRARALLPAAVATALAMPWIAYTVRAAGEPPSDQLLLAGYGTAIFRVVPGDPDASRVGAADWLARIGTHGDAALQDLGAGVLGAPARAAGAALAALAALGLAASLRRRPSLFEWFAVAYSAVLLGYFTYHWRLTVPLVPFVILYALVGLRAFAAHLATLLGAPHRLARRLGHGLALASALALLAHNALRLHEELEPRLHRDGRLTALGASWANLDAVAAWLRAHTDPGDVVLCNQAPIVRLLANRQAYTYRFGRPDELLARYRPDLVVFDAAAPASLRRAVEARARTRVDLPERRTGDVIPIFLLEADAADPGTALR